jgi:hypothetical protein
MRLTRYSSSPVHKIQNANFIVVVKKNWGFAYFIFTILDVMSFDSRV